MPNKTPNPISPDAAYERHREAMRERSAIQSVAGRELGLLPPIKDVRRRAACKYDLARFLKTYAAKKFKKSFCKSHLTYIRALEKAVLEGGKIVIAAPRGVGKSSVSKGAIPWTIAYGHKRSVLVVCATKEEARDFVDEVKRILTNPRFVEDFPEIGVPIAKLNGSNLLARGQVYDGKRTEIVWAADKIKLPSIPGSVASAAVVQSRGIAGAIRGRADSGEETESIRPDFVLGDDLQKSEDARNPDRVRKLLKKWGADVEGLVADGETGSFVVVGTVVWPNDFMATLLDPNQYATYEKIRCQMVEKFPDNMDLWLKDYAKLRRESPEKARAFYRERRAEMDAGAVVDWPENYDRKHEDSRLQRAMNFLIDDPESFYSERQNDPQDERSERDYVKPETTRSRVNGYERYQVPAEADCLTAFVDVHDDILYYAVCAFTQSRVGYVVDYGSFPEQREEYFTKANPGNETLADCFPDADKEGRIQSGLVALLTQIVGESYLSRLGYACNVSRILIDSGYKRAQVENAIIAAGLTNANPSKGKEYSAATTPIAEYRAKPGEVIGWRWLASPTRGRQFKTIVLDVNYWKTDLFDSLRAEPGSAGALSFWGTRPERHQMIAEHVAAEYGTLDERNGRKVYTYQRFPTRDNHLLDCLVGCLAAAAIEGIVKPGERPLE
ncbi:MAG: phage terminase large subunit family protein [Thermoguttaceae bacterium]|nr:phage terminase large subunit family protein [Thermoguttaceae bacterium]